jgi:hypothetical protein
VGLAGTALHDGHHLILAGGPFIELHLIKHWLHLDLAGLFGRGGDANHTILDAVLKVPFEVAPRLELFGGAGLTVSFVSGEAQTEAHPGVTVVGGALYWFLPPVGVVAAAVFNLLAHDGAHPEGGGVLGVAVGI